MSRQFLRLMFLLLLAIALPARGYAGTVMMFCAESHDAMAGEQSAMHHTAGDNGQRHDHAPEHGDNPQLDHADPHTTSVSHKVDDDARSAATGSCSVCGDCCTGLTVGPASPELVAVAAPAADIPFIPSIYAGVDLDRDERPPLVFILA